MRFHPQLFRWQLSILWPVSVIGGMPAAMWILLTRDMLFSASSLSWAALYILLFAILIATILGRAMTGETGFLYTRGHGRDALWAHSMLAAFAAFMQVWLQAALFIWTHARSALQDRLLNNPLYPLMTPRDAAMPWWWLLAYLLVLPVAHYAWLREAQPTRNPSSGNWLFLAWICTAFCMAIVPNTALRQSEAFRPCALTAFGVIALLLLWNGRRLHRRMEVGS